MENKQKSSYSKEELENFKTYIQENPEVEYWTTLDGKKIPFKYIKEDHLKNIIIHLKERKKNAVGFPAYALKDLNSTLNKLETLYKRMLIKKSPAAKVLYANKW